MIMSSMGVTPETIRKIRQSDGDYKTYKYLHSQFLGSVSPKPRKAEAPTAPSYTVTVQASHYMETELRTHTEILKSISAKLAYIVEELGGKEIKSE